MTVTTPLKKGFERMLHNFIATIETISVQDALRLVGNSSISSTFARRMKLRRAWRRARSMRRAAFSNFSPIRKARCTKRNCPARRA